MNTQEIKDKLTEVSNAAGDAWLAKRGLTEKELYQVINGKTYAAILDSCGYSYVRVKDRRNKIFKEFVKNGIFDSEGVINLVPHKFTLRQEYGLNYAIAAAQFSVVKQYIDKLDIWSYED